MSLILVQQAPASGSRHEPASGSTGPVGTYQTASTNARFSSAYPARPITQAMASVTPNGIWSFRKGDQVEEITIDPVMICNSSSAILQAVLGGQGIACLPTYIASRSILKKDVALVLPQYRAAISHTLYAMYFSSKYASPVIRSLRSAALIRGLTIDEAWRSLRRS